MTIEKQKLLIEIDQIRADAREAEEVVLDGCKKNRAIALMFHGLSDRLTKAMNLTEGLGDFNANIADEYHELLWAVSTKHEKESRHATALRYIQQAEEGCDIPQQERVHYK